jgi:hypothetical protein
MKTGEQNTPVGFPRCAMSCANSAMLIAATGTSVLASAGFVAAKLAAYRLASSAKVAR